VDRLPVRTCHLPGYPREVRASRLVSLLLLLQTRGGLTAAELAGELEVSVRTVYRDVDALSEAGVPIYAERGPHGGVRLVDGYRTRLTGLTEDEAKALFLSGIPGPAAELGLGTVVAAARLKMLAALPPELRARASRITQRFHLDAPTWFKPAEAVPHLATLAEAVWEDRVVEVRYERPDKVVTRRLDPLGIVLKGGVWYMVGRADGQIRTYRVSRVGAAALTDGRFDRPAEFDLAGFWTEAIAAYEQTLPVYEVTLRLPPHRLRLLAEVVGEPAMKTAERLEAFDRDGWVGIRLRLESAASAPYQLLTLGADVEVLEPAELRERVIDTARDVLQRYGVGV
jgi:predicted DNA-binding transcriptional regulator YafY